ncbi:hypothetical protein GE061_017316 [Apolygus lucorum]|uniref:Peptidase S1 domain-containing protein n=1 Tax=Apolygus lucorum TaxID=248454 RepID=A0A8S9XCT1_APOLU|nr:hypothetical protein GE061_017316 [Apolygus lucorum]
MGLLTCTVLALLCSSGVQLVKDFREDFKLARERSSYQNPIREKRSNDPNCPHDEETRIANGRDAAPDEFPFIVAIINRKDTPRISDQYCVGTLLTFDVVVKPFNFSRTYDPKYKARVDKMTEDHAPCTTMGWGLDVVGETPSILQVIDSTLRPGNWCSEKITNITKHQEAGPDVFAPRSQICAVGCETGQTVCAGDSGGPLICDKQFIGVVSYGPGDDSCGKNGSPFVYARTDANHLWIWATIAEFSEDDNDAKSMAAQPASQMATMTAISVADHNSMKVLDP